MDYFTEKEPFILLVANHVKDELIRILLPSSYFTKEEVALEE